MADIVASVPELTSRTCSTGARATISSASDTSPGVAAPNDVPRSSAADTADTTAGCACPRIIGPHEQTRSTYDFPSTLRRYAPEPLSMNRGVPPTGPKALRVEITRPGVTTVGRAKRASERAVTTTDFLPHKPPPAMRAAGAPEAADGPLAAGPSVRPALCRTARAV